MLVRSLRLGILLVSGRKMVGLLRLRGIVVLLLGRRVLRGVGRLKVHVMAALRVLGVERMDPGGGARVVIHKDGPARVRVGDALPARG
jgi:hypothetical protein